MNSSENSGKRGQRGGQQQRCRKSIKTSHHEKTSLSISLERRRPSCSASTAAPSPPASGESLKTALVSGKIVSLEKQHDRRSALRLSDANHRPGNQGSVFSAEFNSDLPREGRVRHECGSGSRELPLVLTRVRACGSIPPAHWPAQPQARTPMSTLRPWRRDSRGMSVERTQPESIPIRPVLSWTPSARPSRNDAPRAAGSKPAVAIRRSPEGPPKVAPARTARSGGWRSRDASAPHIT